jgi:hypothetical protein
VTAGVFGEWQPRYAELGIATFPVRDKRPVVRGYLRAGMRASQQFASKFPDEAAFGLACRKNRITVLDVDSPDERLLADALDEFGLTPFIVRSASGNFQAWYRHKGERRRVRPDHRPIDILGDGFVVAPPSTGSKGSYLIIAGSLDDLGSLPTMRAPTPTSFRIPVERIETGRRNQTLWRECMSRAHDCGSISELMEAAVQRNSAMFFEPLPDQEVLQIVASAWAKELAGENWFGRGSRVVLDAAEIDGLLNSDPDAFVLLTMLRRHHWRRQFVIANAMADSMPRGGWRRQRFAAARRRLIEIGAIEEIRPPSPQRGPAVYQFHVSKNGHQ